MPPDGLLDMARAAVKVVLWLYLFVNLAISHRAWRTRAVPTGLALPVAVLELLLMFAVILVL